MGTTQSVLKDGFLTLRIEMQLVKELETLGYKERKTTSALIREAIIERVRNTTTPH